MLFVTLSTINQFAHVHQVTLAHHTYSVVYHLMNHIQFVQNVKAI